MNPIYQAGLTPDGTLLIGGVWTLFSQEGVPLELSHVKCLQDGKRVDWCEAMADASITNNLPALMGHIAAFLKPEEIEQLMAGFMRLLKNGFTYEDIMKMKRQGTQ